MPCKDAQGCGCGFRAVAGELRGWSFPLCQPGLSPVTFSLPVTRRSRLCQASLGFQELLESRGVRAPEGCPLAIHGNYRELARSVWEETVLPFLIGGNMRTQHFLPLNCFIVHSFTFMSLAK